MKEYTLLSFSSVIFTVLVDRLSKVNILKKNEFYLFLAIILAFKFMVNGYLTNTRIVVYNPDYFMGLRWGSIPYEDFLFGFSLVTLGIIFWELLKEKKHV
jgi:lycopene cyclase domain-containing protein